MAQLANHPPIIIKKVKKGHGHGHHGGAWKVAYADFVTAMMAFFLLLWLLASSSEEQKRGIADYFSPSAMSQSTTSGAGGMLGGLTITSQGAARDDRTPMGVTVGLPAETETEDPSEFTDGDADPKGEGDESGDGTWEEEMKARQEEQRAREEEAFAEAAEKLRTAIESVPDLADLADNLIVDQTPEGMRIQIVDQSGTSMFPSGSADMHGHTRKLMKLVSEAIGQMPNRIAIKGHTDSTPFRGGGSYGNWELSSDRALASRRALVEAGLPQSRIAHVVGKADTEPFDAADPTAPTNRRISIIMLREDMQPTDVPPAEPAATPHAAAPSDGFQAPSVLEQ